MQHETKNERREKKALGYKHEWTDTGGHSHRVIFDKKTLERPQTTWKALIVVAALGLLVGGVAILTAPRKAAEPLPLAPTNVRPDFALAATLRNLTTERPVALAAGWGDEFFLADKGGVGLYRVGDGARLQYWESPEGDAPTALTFVADETSEKNGALLIAYPERIDAIYFAPDRVSNDASANEGEKKNDEEADATETTGATVRSAQDAALGAATTILSIPGASIAALAATPERLFVGDFNADCVRRYSWRKLDALRDVEKKETPPDCEIGAPDGALAYPGLRPATEPYMCVVYSPSTNEIVVANSGLFRVDAFNVDSGVWNAEHSWTKAPGTERAFSGAANPIALVVSPSGWIATAETGKIDVAAGKKSPLQIFDAKSGSWISEIAVGVPAENGARVASPIGLAISEDGRQILALKSNGEVEIYANR